MTGEAHCYAPPDDKYGSSDTEKYIFGLEPKAKPVGRFNGQEFTLFTAMFSGCGSGTLTHISLLTVRDGEFVDLLPKVELTNQSEYKLWNLAQFSTLPIFATADFVWDFNAGETHFAPHRYTVNIYVFDAQTSGYTQRVGYVTTMKYPGLDDSGTIRVLEAEKPTILAKMKP